MAAEQHIENVAILVDGGFYRVRAFNLFGEKGPVDRANELITYCNRHLLLDQSSGSRGEKHRLYRIFYYDCPPMERNLYHPLQGDLINMKKEDQYQWSKTFFKELANKRKVALRMGELQEKESGFRIKAKTTNKLCRKEISIDDLTMRDFEPDFVQKGVDMRIGLDIASLAHK